MSASVPASRLAAVLFAVAGGAALVPGNGPAVAVQLPPGFADQTLPWSFDVPTALAFLPGGRLLVAEKGGIVYVVEGGERHPLWVREEEVLNTDDRGLLAVAVDPDFATNHYLYFLYTVDPDSNGIELDNYDDAFSRLTRYQLSATDSNVVDYSTRTVLLGAGWGDFPSASGTHNIADLLWGRDGSLLLSAGDGAHFDFMDPGGFDPGQFDPGRTDPIEDIGAFRSQFLGSLDGKVLRIDAATGHGFPSNPYYDGDPASKLSRIWAYGLRNPFRMALRPHTGSLDPAAGNPGTIYLGDVGWMTWEEVDVVDQGGRNFGWPCFEGFSSQPDYQGAAPAHSGCETIGAPANPAPPRPPLLAFHHADADSSLPPVASGGVLVGGVFYTGESYPYAYRDRYFFGDYLRDWIKVAVTDPADQLVEVLDFATGADGPVCFAADPASGDLYYAAIYTGQVHRIRYTGTVAAPSAPAPPLTLSAPRPSPGAGTVAMTLDLPAPARLQWRVVDVGGRERWNAPAQWAPAGRTVLVWPGLDRAGAALPAGVYFAQVQVDDHMLTRRFVQLH